MVCVCRWVDTRHQWTACPQRQGNCCINTHTHTLTEGGCQYFSHHFICLHSFLSSLIIYFSGLTHVSSDILHITHTHTWNFYENFLSLCLSSFSASECLWIWCPCQMIIHRDLLPEAPGGCETGAGIIYSIHTGLYNNKLGVTDICNSLPPRLLLYLQVQSHYYSAWGTG